MNDTVSGSASRYVAMWFGIMTAMGHWSHGILEALQGNIPTKGPFIYAVPAGNDWSVWKDGGEAAITLFPTMLSSGIASILVGLIVILWSIAFMHRRGGSLVYLGLCVVSLLTGGGVGQIVFFTLIFAFATRVGKPHAFWKKALPPGALPGLGRWWKVLTLLSMLLFAISLELAVWGYFPMVREPRTILVINWSFLLVTLVLMAFSFVSAFADDINRESGLRTRSRQAVSF